MSSNHMPRFNNPALCAESDPDAWFDYKVVGTRVEGRLENVKNICRQCPALDECRAYSLQYSNLFGVWGGLDHIERAKIQRDERMKTIDWHSTFETLTNSQKATIYG